MAGSLWELISRYALKFGVVGGLGFIIDLGISNALWAHGLSTGSDAWMYGPVGAKLISTSVAILFNWVGNRYWVFRAHRRRDVLKELFEFVIVSIGGMLIALGALWFTHHVLGLNNLVANNVAGNVVGLGLGTIFRFVLYRYWVYGHHRTEVIEGAEDELELAELAMFVEPTETGSVPVSFKKARS
ncbi:MAG: GtrA family protein [Microbacteriaceae bacterium]